MKDPRIKHPHGRDTIFPEFLDMFIFNSCILTMTSWIQLSFLRVKDLINLKRNIIFIDSFQIQKIFQLLSSPLSFKHLNASLILKEGEKIPNNPIIRHPMYRKIYKERKSISK